MARVVLITGGNLGDVKSRLRTAQRMINDKVGIVLRCSHRYKSRPWGFSATDEFSNQVLEVDTDLSADEVLDAVQEIERELGRDRDEEARIKAEAEAMAEKLNAVQLTISTKVSATGQIYGSVNNLHIAEELAKLGLEVNRKIIVMKDVKEVGSYVALVKLHKDVTANVAFDVVAEGVAVEVKSEEA